MLRKTLLLLVSLCLPLLANEDPEKDKAPVKDQEPLAAPVTREGSVMIDGNKIDYEVTSSKLTLKKDDGTERASIFHVSYLKKKVDDASKRPVMFAFNGGPGSSAVWLHLGMLGPKRVELPGDGTSAPQPPTRLVENEYSILDLADLVFVDPVSTGYSRNEEGTEAKEFHGLREDIESMSDFIRRWITEHNRWSSPKYLLGESYGGIRVAGLAEHLQSRYGMSLNGVILLSSLLDFRTLKDADGDPLMYSVFLPAYTAVAHYHGKIEGDRDALVAEAREFAFNDYALALLAGNTLSADRKQAVAEKLSKLTSLDPQLLIDLKLRVNPSRFRAELLADEGKVVGRFDARVAWPEGTKNTWPSHDPSFSLAYGAYSTAMLTYLTEELGWEEERPYEIITNKVRPWKWHSENEVVNVSDKLAAAMRNNPHLRVLVMKGFCDLATPPEGIDYSLRQLIDSPESALERIEHVEYEAGHMFYLNPPDLKKSRMDLVDFLTETP